VLTYNILAELYSTSQVYPYCPSWALAWSYRKKNIMREIGGYNADVLALQEVQADHYREYIEPEMRVLGYEGVFKKKTREAMGMDGKMDGCAIFYKRDKCAALCGPADSAGFCLWRSTPWSLTTLRCRG
jgi:CCR4-NOT transcription complex subunit 6